MRSGEKKHRQQGNTDEGSDTPEYVTHDVFAVE
jgi:hypothetical protein